MTYPEAIQYLESFIDYEKIPAWSYKESLKLQRIKDFLDIIGKPQDFLRCIHVAGSKGKGSTCAFITYILRQAGFKTGLYTSPHLSDFRERIRILAPNSELLTPNYDFEGMIPQAEFTSLVQRLKPAIDKYNKESDYGPLSFFEAYTALAFTYFKECGVEFAVLETGLGGRLDATNTVDPLVCVITPLSYEHTQKLGNTLAEIAAEKAGIIKAHDEKYKAQSTIVISATQEKEAQEVVRNRCKEVNARLYEVGRDIFFEKAGYGFNALGIFGEYPNLEIRLLGRHQIMNACVAVGAIEALRFYDIIMEAQTIRDGLYNTFWPGRCEVVCTNPLVVLDGAQNIVSARAIKEAIKENFQYNKLILVLGISKDKDVEGICGQLDDLADEIVLTRSDNPRAAEPKMLAGYFSGKKVHLSANVKDAKAKAEHITKKEDLILFTGSLFVVGEARGLFRKG